MQLLTQTITNMLIAGGHIHSGRSGLRLSLQYARFFNIAHGAIYMVSGYLGYLFIAKLGLNRG